MGSKEGIAREVGINPIDFLCEILIRTIAVKRITAYNLSTMQLQSGSSVIPTSHKELDFQTRVRIVSFFETFLFLNLGEGNRSQFRPTSRMIPLLAFVWRWNAQNLCATFSADWKVGNTAAQHRHLPIFDTGHSATV